MTASTPYLDKLATLELGVFTLMSMLFKGEITERLSRLEDSLFFIIKKLSTVLDKPEPPVNKKLMLVSTKKVQRVQMYLYHKVVILVV